MVSNDSTDMKTFKCWIRERKTYADVQQPVCVNNYNKHMGYVDVRDQQCSTYRLRIRQRKWWWPIFSHLLVCTVNNACALMKNSVPTMNNYKFIEFLVLFYCKSYGTPSLSAGRPPSTKITDIARFDGKNHWIVHIEKTRRCKLCQSNAMFRCDKCDVGFNLKCFKTYHTSQQFFIEQCISFSYHLFYF